MTHTNNTTQTEAARLISEGCDVVPLRPREKKARDAGYQDHKFAATDFGPDDNIGVKLGAKSGGRVDVDCDTREAAQAAKAFIPTGDVFGRLSKPNSHRIVTLQAGDEPIRNQVFANAFTGEPTFELRSDGVHTMFPPSIHPSGERVEWATRNGPTACTNEDLMVRAGMVAVVASMAQNWTDFRGRHHDFALAFAGTMLKSKRFAGKTDLVEGMLRVISAVAGDHEPDDRVRAVRDTANRLEAEETVAGVRKLADVIGWDATRQFLQWLRIESDETFGFNDVDNAGRLVARHGENFRVAPGLGTLAYDGARWRPDDLGAFNEAAKETARAIPAEARFIDDEDKLKKLYKHAAASLSAPAQKAMIQLAKTDPRIAIRDDAFDTDPFAFNVLNGTINLRTGGIAPHQRYDYITKLAPVRFDPKAECPNWERYLERVLSEAAERAFLKRIVGYCLTGLATEKAILLLWGMTDTGKTTLIEILHLLFGGDYAVVANEALIAGSKHGSSSGIPNDLARLRGSRLVTVSETAEGAHINEARLKAMAGRTRMSARFMRGEFFDFDPTFKLIIDTNHRPVVKDSDDAFWNRLKLLEFKVQIPKSEQIQGFADMLKSELPGILNWAVDGCLEWQRIGLSEPDSVKLATQSYRDDMNPVEDFFTERCEFGTDATVTHSALFAAYMQWAEDNGMRYPLGKRTFTARAAERPGVVKAHGTGNVAIFKGVGLRAGARPEPIRPDVEGFNPFKRRSDA